MTIHCYCVWGQVSGVQVGPSKVDLGNCKVAPRRLTHSGTGVLKGEGEMLGSKEHRWTGSVHENTGGRSKVSWHRWSLGTPGRKGAMSRFE